MRWSTIALVVLGLVAALGAAVLVTMLRLEDRRDDNGGVKEVTIYVAAEPLPAMAVVNANSVMSSTVPTEEAPPDYVPSAALIIGKVLAVPMVKGQVFRPVLFVTEGSGAHLAAALPEGHRAVSIPLSRGSSLEGLLYPGSVVDVVACFDRPSKAGGAGESLSVPLLESVQVLAVEKDTVVGTESGMMRKGGLASASSRTIVTLMVDTAQAQALQLASEHGTLMLAMRNPLDRSTAGGSYKVLSEISPALEERPFRLPEPTPEQPKEEPKVEPAEDPSLPPPPPPVRKVRQYKVEVIHGSKTEILTFSEDESF